MVARLQAQAREVAARASEASRTGDQQRFERLHRLWIGLMKTALSRADHEDSHETKT